jgi:hypothetical protein
MTPLPAPRAVMMMPLAATARRVGTAQRSTCGAKLIQASVQQYDRPESLPRCDVWALELDGALCQFSESACELAWRLHRICALSSRLNMPSQMASAAPSTSAPPVRRAKPANAPAPVPSPAAPASAPLVHEAPPGRRFYFAFGANLSPTVLLRRNLRPNATVVGTVINHKLVFQHGGGADVSPRSTAHERLRNTQQPRRPEAPAAVTSWPGIGFMQQRL